jgi:hypothetical protein
MGRPRFPAESQRPDLCFQAAKPRSPRSPLVRRNAERTAPHGDAYGVSCRAGATMCSRCRRHRTPQRPRSKHKALNKRPGLVPPLLRTTRPVHSADDVVLNRTWRDVRRRRRPLKGAVCNCKVAQAFLLVSHRARKRSCLWSQAARKHSCLCPPFPSANRNVYTTSSRRNPPDPARD